MAGTAHSVIYVIEIARPLGEHSQQLAVAVARPESTA
jgi:hypothetical protein